MKGATEEQRILTAQDVDFNPRTREGCDGNDAQAVKGPKNISIHAPVKGATFIFPVKVDIFVRFQSTHP